MFIARRSIKYQAKGKTQQQRHQQLRHRPGNTQPAPVGSQFGNPNPNPRLPLPLPGHPLGIGKHVPIDRILTEAISLFGVWQTCRRCFCRCRRRLHRRYPSPTPVPMPQPLQEQLGTRKSAPTLRRPKSATCGELVGGNKGPSGGSGPWGGWVSVCAKSFDCDSINKRYY